MVVELLQLPVADREGRGEAADPVGRFDDPAAESGQGEFVRGGQAGEAGADHDHIGVVGSGRLFGEIGTGAGKRVVGTGQRVGGRHGPSTSATAVRHRSATASTSAGVLRAVSPKSAPR